jgi:hypothetical protein
MVMGKYVQCPKDGQREYLTEQTQRWVTSAIVPLVACGFCGEWLRVTGETIKEGAE